jgi:hypothetical protein
MGGLVVGNYDTSLEQGKAFIYNIDKDKYYDISWYGIKSITAYGIWHNSGHHYTICGGYSELDAETGLSSAYLVDWNSKDEELSYLRKYSFGNDPLKAIVTHFDGISAGGKCSNKYYLTGDWLDIDGQAHAFFATTNDRGKAKWSDVVYPSGIATSGNSVSKNVVIGSYVTEQGNANGYVSI